MSHPKPPLQIVKRGVVAVIRRDARWLVIERAAEIRAGGALCFPGGGIEPNETEEAALHREMREELDLAVQPLCRLWEHTTDWGVHLAWWHAAIEPAAVLCPNPDEVAACYWMTTAETLASKRLLTSNRAFFAALAAGEFEV